MHNVLSCDCSCNVIMKSVAALLVVNFERSLLLNESIILWGMQVLIGVCISCCLFIHLLS
jgi:hypothetical protein